MRAGALLDPALGCLIVAAAALLFAGASLHKARRIRRFTQIFAAYRVLPDAWAQRLAWLVPCIEGTIAVAVAWPATRRAALLAGVAALLVYAAAIGVNLLRGRSDLDCGCGAARERRRIAAWMVWRNLALAAALGVALLPWRSRPWDPTDVITLVGGLIVSVTLYAAVDRLLGLVTPRGMMLRRAS